MDFLALDPQPDLHLQLPAWARENAHAVRWQITSEMWETLNSHLIEMQRVRRGDLDRRRRDASSSTG